MPRQRFVFEGWEDGEYGDKPPEIASFKAYTGSNMIRYRAGLLGPRPGLAAVPVSGNVAGRVWGFHAPTTVNAALCMVIEDTVYRAASDFDIILTAVTGGPHLTATPTAVCPFTVISSGSETYFTSPGQQSFHYDVTGDTITEILWDPGVTDASIGPVALKGYRDRLYMGGVPSGGPITFYQLAYSEAADFTNIPAINFISVGYDSAVYVLEGLGNNLVIGTRLSWWALVGGTITGTLRQIYTADPPSKQSTVVNYQGLLWYWAQGYVGGPENGGENGEARLSFTNGTVFDTDEYNHLALSGLKFGLALPKVDAIYFSSDEARALVRMHDAWSFLDFEVETTGPIAGVNDATRVVHVANDRGTSEVESITITATGGSWDLTCDAGSIAGIAWDVTLEELQSLVYFGLTGGCDVTAGTSGVDFVLTFVGSNQGLARNVVIDDTNATGGTVTSTTTTAGAASEADYYQLRLDLERPGFVDGFLENPGDNSDTPIDAWMRTKVVRAPEGQEMRVRKVLVEFQKWDTGVTNNGFSIAVDTYDRLGTDDYATETIAWTEAANVAPNTAAGQSDKIQKNFGAKGYGSGFCINITDVVGCAIRRIIAEVDVDPARQPGGHSDA